MIHLVPSSGHNANNAWFKTPENIQAFTTSFTFHIDCSASPSDCGDGFGFELLCACTGGNPTYDPANGHPGYTYSGYSGGQFSWSQCNSPFTSAACVGGDLKQLPDNVLVKFDIYNDQTGAAGAELTGYYTDGEYLQVPYNPQIDMSGSGINLQSGHEFSATLVYNGSTLVETLTDTATRATFTHTYTGVNIPAAITGNTAFIGFGGDTGAAVEDVYLDTWTYTVKQLGQMPNMILSYLAPTPKPRSPGRLIEEASRSTHCADHVTLLIINSSHHLVLNEHPLELK